MISDAEMLAMASAFDVLPYAERPGVHVRMIRVETRSGLGDPPAWAITNNGSNLSRDGEWEHEPSNSNKTEEFLSRCRWSSAQEAIEFAREHLQKYPTGYKPATSS